MWIRYRNWSLRKKIALPIFMAAITVIAVSIWFMTERTQKLAIDQAIDIADAKAMSSSQDIMNTLNSAMSVSRTLQAVFDEAMKADPIPQRAYFAKVLRAVLDSHPELSGTWVACLPNTFDGREDEYKAVWNGTMRVYHYRNGGSVETAYEGAETLNGDWFDLPMAGTGETITKPYPWEVNGTTNWVASTGFPVRKGNKNIGVVGVDFYLTELQEMVEKIKPYDTGYAFLTGNDGTIIAHPQEDYLGKSLTELLDGAHRQSCLDAVASGKRYSFTAPNVATGRMEYVTAMPVSIGHSTTPWSLAVAIPLAEVKDKARTVANTGMIIGGAAVLILLVLVLCLAQVIVRPILRTVEYARTIADGNLDISLDIEQKDEIGVMADSLRKMVATLRDFIAQAESKTRQAEEESEKARQAMADAEEARNQAVEARKAGLQHAAGRVSTVLDGIVAATSQMTRQADLLLNDAQEQRDRVSSTATAMEEMNATVLEIARNAGDASSAGVQAQKTATEGASAVDASKDAMKATKAEVNSLNENMRKLEEQARDIGAIISVINDIADQTNLLALNAAIEAARAGEAGRGFAVVADEVRKLAEKTMQATQEVSSSIGAIQKVADTNLASMGKVFSNIETADSLSLRSGEMLRDIVQGAENSAAQITGIAAAAEQQSATSEEINGVIVSISKITQRTADNARDFSSALHSLDQRIGELNTIVTDLKQG